MDMLHSKSNFVAYTQLHISVLLFGGAGLFAKLIPLAPTLIVWGRTFWACLFLWLLMRLIREPIGKLRRADYRNMLVLGAILAFHWVAFFKSIQLSNVALGLLTFSSFPIFTVLFAPLFFKEKIALKDLALAFLALLGVLVIVPFDDLWGNYSIAIAWGVASGASFAVLALLNKQLVVGYSANKVALFQNFGAAICLLPWTFINSWQATPLEYGYWVLLGIVFTGLSHLLFISSLKTLKPQLVSLVAALEPVYGILWALCLLGEIPLISELFGGAIILVAAGLAIFSNKA